MGPMEQLGTARRAPTSQLSTINGQLSTESHHFLYKFYDDVTEGDVALLDPVG